MYPIGREMFFEKAKWIWAEENTHKNDWVVFCREINLDDIPDQAYLNIAVDSKYYLIVNDRIVVFDGGLNRSANRGDGYFDRIEIVPHLRKGNNEIQIRAWYWGNEGRNNVDSGAAGLLISCEELPILSDKSWRALRDPAHYETGEPRPAYLYGGHNIGYDANNEGDHSDISSWPEAVEYGSYGDTPWGTLCERPIPLFRFSEIQSYPLVENPSTGVLPYAMQFTPYFRVKARGGERIDIRSDRYLVNGGPGDTNAYRSHRVEYICKEGENSFEGLNWLFGEKVIYSIPESVEVLELGYRESGYDTDFVGSFESDQSIADTLVQKSLRTLYICMRDNFMDCPDRERGQWIGDVSHQVLQVPYVLDQRALMLVRKAIDDFIFLRSGDVLMGNIPGSNSSELPSQSLNAISEYGMIASYFQITRDSDCLRECYEPVLSYLRLFEMGDDGLIQSRKGNWAWHDHLYNIDDRAIENAWYYSALKFALMMAEEIGETELPPDLFMRKASIAENYHKHFWKSEGSKGYFSSRNIVDDRANGLAVICGLAEPKQYDEIRKVLLNVQNATPYMEYYILEALCQMGYLQEAYSRMIERYYHMANSENSTLWEDFHTFGTRNHAWSGGPLTILYRYFAGITIHGDVITISKDLPVLEKLNCTIPFDGQLIKVSKTRNGDGTKVKVNNSSSAKIKILD